jgi:hypothetical protein
MSHKTFHDGQSLETWIEHDSHHVVNLPCIKKPQEIQKRFDHLYNFKSHMSMQKQDFSLKKVKNFK